MSETIEILMKVQTEMNRIADENVQMRKDINQLKELAKVQANLSTDVMKALKNYCEPTSHL